MLMPARKSVCGSAATQEQTERMIGAGVRFERVRRITGYLVGTLDRFNNAKRAEERDRVKHSLRPPERNA